MSERVSERVSAAECASKVSRAEQAQRVSGTSELANGQACGPVLQSVFLVVLAHSGQKTRENCAMTQIAHERGKWRVRSR